MSLIPNLKSIFKESLEAASADNPYGGNPCPHCGEVQSGTFRHKGAPAFCKNGHKWGGSCGHSGECENTPSKVVEANSVNMELEKGADHEQKEHGLTFELARKLAADHIREHPGYYAKMAQCGLDEELSTNPAPAGAPNNTPQTPQPQNNNQDPPQDPKKIEEYQKKAADFDKKIQMSISSQQKLTKQKNDLDKKIQNLNLMQQKATKDKADLAKKLGINQLA